jgi:predicted short-subunit dehydrogenase-like oxidoreductase (DUF2520 family)
MSAALARVGWSVADSLGRGDDVSAAATDVDVVIVAVPDDAVGTVASMIDARREVAVVHLAGSLGLDVLDAHPRRAAVHPLVALPNAELGAERLLAGAWFAVAGDAMARRIVDDLGGHAFEVDDAHRAEYHAAAVIASNHVVALLGQAERVAVAAGVPFVAYLDLVRATIDNVAELGPRDALTGPAARGDWTTIDRHLAALAPDEREAYEAMVKLARRLVD